MSESKRNKYIELIISYGLYASTIVGYYYDDYEDMIKWLFGIGQKFPIGTIKEIKERVIADDD